MLTWLHEHLLYLDYKAWYFINTQWHCGMLDFVIPFARNQYTWAPLYLFLLVFTTMNFGKKGWMWCVFFLLTFALSDYTNTEVLKPYFHRTRPCNNPYLFHIVRLIVPRGGGYSFPSTHAMNHFSLGMFMAASLGKKYHWVWFAAIFWAILVAYSQVYVGVHFPLDVFCGGLLGGSIGLFTARIYNYRYPLA